MGTLAALKKEKKRLRDNNNEFSHTKTLTRKSQTQLSTLEELKLQTKGFELNRMNFQNYPYIGWGIGILMVMSGLYLIYHISLGKYGDLFSEFREGYIYK